LIAYSGSQDGGVHCIAQVPFDALKLTIEMMAWPISADPKIASHLAKELTFHNDASMLSCSPVTSPTLVVATSRSQDGGGSDSH
jgi:hypothetical protein